jgi:hypothetical protein
MRGFEGEVIKTARYISSISKDIPIQVMRFIPFGEASIDLEPTIKESEMIHAILVAVNADDKDLGKIWSDVIRGDYFKDVYYSMGYPLFALNGKRFENDLVETAGGDSVNKLIKRGGKPGINISRNEFNGLNISAVKNKRIYRIYPGWNFGSPRWILGLMYIANEIHPEIFNFNIDDEADKFYGRFYRLNFSSIEPNRSFYRASAR